MGAPYCPNPQCPKGALKAEEKCPLCGTPAERLGILDATRLMKEKRALQTEKKEEKEGAKDVLVSEEMTDEQIQRDIVADMANLRRHERGTGIDSFWTIITGTAIERISASLLKAIVDENKILIRQNALILRSLKRLSSSRKD